MKRTVRDHFSNTDGWPGLECSDPSLTDQSQAADCDVNNIVARYIKTGYMPNYAKDPLYGDFTGVKDFQESLHIVMRAEEQFMGLSADIRKRFENDPAKFLAFVEDGKNEQELIKMGLANPRSEGSVTPPSQPVAPAPAGAGAS